MKLIICIVLATCLGVLGATNNQDTVAINQLIAAAPGAIMLSSGINGLPISNSPSIFATNVAITRYPFTIQGNSTGSGLAAYDLIMTNTPDAWDQTGTPQYAIPTTEFGYNRNPAIDYPLGAMWNIVKDQASPTGTGPWYFATNTYGVTVNAHWPSSPANIANINDTTGGGYSSDGNHAQQDASIDFGTGMGDTVHENVGEGGMIQVEMNTAQRDPTYANVYPRRNTVIQNLGATCDTEPFEVDVEGVPKFGYLETFYSYAPGYTGGNQLMALLGPYTAPGGTLTADAGYANLIVSGIVGGYNLLSQPSLSNYWFGASSGTASATGVGNVGGGFGVQYSLTSGTYNTTLGAYSQSAMTGGSGNTSVGVSSLQNLLNGMYNVAVGDNAGSALSGSEAYNIDIGNNGVAGDVGRIRIGTVNVQTNTILCGDVSTGSNVTAALNLNGNALNLTSSAGVIYHNNNLYLYSHGAGNFSAGDGTGSYSSTGTGNTGIGEQVMPSVAAGSGNTAEGYFPLFGVTSGSYNVAIGNSAGADITSGSGNTLIGYDTGRGLTSGSDNTIIGGLVTEGATYNQTVVIADGTGRMVLQDYDAGYTIFPGIVLASNGFCGNGALLTNIPTSALIALPIIPQQGFYGAVGTGWTNTTAKRGTVFIPFAYSTGIGTGWNATLYITNYSGLLGGASTITNIFAVSQGAAGLTGLAESGSNYFTGNIYSNSMLNIISTVGTVSAVNVTNNQSQIEWQ